MENLLKVLTEKTQELKVQYIEKTKEWAKARFDNTVQILSWNEVKWCEYFGLTPKPCNPGTSMEFLGMPSGFYSSKDARKQDSMQAEARSMKRLGKDGYIQKEVEAAERHYSNSVFKLTERLIKKGIDDKKADKVKIVSGWVGINFEVTIEVENIRVKAWTIIASGPIQRPHYRYLIK